MNDVQLRRQIFVEEVSGHAEKVGGLLGRHGEAFPVHVDSARGAFGAVGAERLQLVVVAELERPAFVVG
jgi:hypothetical protein